MIGTDTYAVGDRAVSDLVGYVIIFGLLLTSVGIVATLGVDQLDAVQTEQQTINADRSLGILAESVDEIQKSRATARATDVALDSGRFSTMVDSGPSGVTVTVDGTSVSETVDMETLTYQGDEERVVYEGGAILGQTQTGGQVLRRAPPYVCSNGQAIVSIVTLQGPSEGLHFSGGTASVRVREDSSRLIFPVNRTGPDSLDESTAIEVEVDSEYDDAWHAYFVDDENDWQHVSGSRYRCDPAGSVHVRQTTVNVSVAR